MSAAGGRLIEDRCFAAQRVTHNIHYRVFDDASISPTAEYKAIEWQAKGP